MNQDELEDLLDKMTLHEKIGQMTQISSQYFKHLNPEFDNEILLYSEDILQGENLYKIGSVLGLTGAKNINKLQREYLANSRLKIPLLFAHDAIHGYKTIFPIPLALSCSWDTELAHEIARVTAEELRAVGIHVNLAPMVDLVRDARWGRVMEAFGEDQLLSGAFGSAMIQGYQQGEDGAIGANGVAATLKHFGACGAAIAGKEYNTVDMSWREFLDYYGKPYEMAIKEKPRFVMSSFNAFNGMPVTGNEEMMNDILRERYGFEDLTISDWGSVIELTNHRIVENNHEAAHLALSSGTDIEMSSGTYLENCDEIIKKDPDLLHYINEVVYKILYLKKELGLFENPYVDESVESELLLTDYALNLSRTAAQKSSVLLKNDNDLLPISTKYKNILLVGPFAKTHELLGAWHCEGKHEDVVSIDEGMRDVFKESVIHAYDSLETCPRDILQIIDYAVVTIGEYWDFTGEGRSSVNLDLEHSQRRLIRDVKKLNIPYACVALSGRPLALQDIIDDIPALLWAWYPGTQGGIAIAQMLAGLVSPSGKLTMSFPRYSAQTPIHYNEYSSGRPTSSFSFTNRYQDSEPGPLFAFGHGLNYASITYSNYAISNYEIKDGSNLEISFDIKNHSAMSATETAILYIKDVVSKSIRPVREMKKWKKIELKPFETKSISIKLNVEDLCYLNSKLENVVEPGDFKIYLNDLKDAKFIIKYVN